MSQEKYHPIKKEKIRKRQELLKQGVDPYPHEWRKESWNKRTAVNQLEREFDKILQNESENQQKIFYIAGRLLRKRDMGKTAFFNIQDEEGCIQCYIKRDDFPKNANPLGNNQMRLKDDSNDTTEKPYRKNDTPLSPWELWKLCDIGDIMSLSGVIFKTKKGELSLRVQDLKILCKGIESLPEKYHGLEDKELKYRYRHLDLIMNPQSRTVFKIRSQVIQEIRNFMQTEGFMEVETPILQPLYGGAVAEPFETYFRRLNRKMYLKISPEIYLKKLIVGGFEKVFEIGKNFRNEGIDRTHNPEFTMMEYYEAYTDYEDQMSRFEDLICYVSQKIKKYRKAIYPEKKLQNEKKASAGEVFKLDYQGKVIDFTPPWVKISLKVFEGLICSVIKNTDRGLKLQYQEKEWDINEFWKEINREIHNIKQAFNSEINNQSKIKKLNDFSNFWKQESIKTLKDETDKKLNQFWKNIAKADRNQSKDYEKILNYAQAIDPKAKLEKFKEALETEAPPSREELTNLKEELVLMACEWTVEKYFWNPVFITDFPLTLSPLTKKHRDKNQPRSVERFEPYIAGMELGNAYTELNDPVDQRKRLAGQKRWSEESTFVNQTLNNENTSEENTNSIENDHPLDENFIHALEVGMPPTGGVGLGIERLVMILSDQKNIRDSILFPILKDKPK